MDVSDMLTKAKPILLKVLTAVIALLLIKLLPKAGVTLSPDEVKCIAGLAGTIILGIGMNWAAKTHATIRNLSDSSGDDAAPAAPAAPTPQGGGTAKAFLFIILSIGLFGSMSSCKTINKDALASWMAVDREMVEDLMDYRKAAGKPTDDLEKHLAKTIDQIEADEENTLMVEIQTDIQNDPKRISNRKVSYQRKITSHLVLFNSLKGN